MKKIYNIVVLALVLALSITTVYGSGFGGGSRGGTFGTSGFGASTENTQVSYDGLSNMCLDLNADIVGGVYDNIEPFRSAKSSGTALSATISYNSANSKYVITVYYRSVTYYFCNNSGGVYYAVAESLNPAELGPIRSILSSIADVSSSINSKLQTIADRIYYTDSTGDTWRLSALAYYTMMGTYDVKHLCESIVGYIDGVEGALSTANTRLSTLIGHVDDIEGYVDGLEELIGLTNTRLSTIVGHVDGLEDLIATTNNRLSTIAGHVDGIEDSLSTIIDLLSTDSYMTGYLKDTNGNSFPTQSIPYESAAQIVARMNSVMGGKTVTLLKRDGSGTVSKVFVRAYLNSSGYIMVRAGTEGYYLCDSNNSIFVAGPKLDYTAALAALGTKLNDIDGGINDQMTALDNGVDRLDQIIELLQENSSVDHGDHEHVYDHHISQQATCTAPGLEAYTCSECGYGYSQILPALGHDWDFQDHVDPVLDDDGEELVAGYDIYICSRCDHVEHTSSGSGAPASGANRPISDLIASIFSRLGKFFGGLLSGVFQLLDKLLTGFDNIVTSFNDRAQEISHFGGDYPAWLGGVWDIMPDELQLALGFCLVVSLVGIIGKKLAFNAS